LSTVSAKKQLLGAKAFFFASSMLNIFAALRGVGVGMKARRLIDRAVETKAGARL
jgi:hypothetical protein